MRELPIDGTTWELFEKARQRYWILLSGASRKKVNVPLIVEDVLDENGMANDPARDEMLRDICSRLGSWNRDQLELFSNKTPSLLLQ